MSWLERDWITCTRDTSVDSDKLGGYPTDFDIMHRHKCLLLTVQQASMFPQSWSDQEKKVILS